MSKSQRLLVTGGTGSWGTELVRQIVTDPEIERIEDLAGLSEVEIRVPHFGFADRIQEIHIKVIHTLILLIEKLVA